MNYATVCSGIEAPSVGFEKLGWTPVWFSEIEKFPSSVLKFHYPHVPNLGDMTKLKNNSLYVESNSNGGGQIAIAQGYTIHGTEGTVNVATETDVHSALRSRTPGTLENSTTTVVVDTTQVTSRENRSNPQENDPCHTLAKGTQAPLLVRPQVRRLTPLECERPQGFPDNYTKVPGCSDSTRYQAIGNSMTTHVLEWIGSRIDKVDKLLKSLE